MKKNPSPEKLSLEVALELVLSHIHPIRGVEIQPLLDSVGMICAADIFARHDVPPFDRSPLDGFAFNSADTQGASRVGPARLSVCGILYAGDVPEGELRRGEAVKIMTGAMLPPSADCVAAKENVTETEGCVYIGEAYSPHQNYIFRGSDVKKGALLVHRGTKLNFFHAGIAAGSGTGELPVYRKLNVGLFCAGDELIEPGEPAREGKIFDSVYPLLAGRIQALGFTVNRSDPGKRRAGTPLPDRPREVADYIDSRIHFCDLFITTGGVSVGDKDIFHEVFTILKVQKLFWRMNFKPGMSVLCGVYKEKLLMCLSGNPFAAFTVFELLARPALEKLSGRTGWSATLRRGVVKNAPGKTGGIRRFIRAFFDGTYVTFPGGNTNAEIFSLCNCNCLADIPGDAPHPGDTVGLVLL